jgi:hypothetical protein
MVSPEGRVKVLDFGLAKLNETTFLSDATSTNLGGDPLTGEGRKRRSRGRTLAFEGTELSLEAKRPLLRVFHHAIP